MKNILKYTAILAVICLALSSCSDWTETKSLNIDEADIKKDNPELYAKYLANLRDYRKTEHMLTYVWFDNSLKTPVTRAHHINVIPDSVDIISLLSPEKLDSRELAEISEVREKGTKVIYTISYPAIELLYKAKLEADAEAAGDEWVEPETDGFPDFCATYMDEALSYVSKFGYDGVAVLYNGKITTHMTESEKTEYLARQEAFMSKVRSWVATKGNKMFVFEGKPENLTDKTILESAEYIVLRSFSATSGSYLDYEIRMSAVSGVPADRFILGVQSVTLDAADKLTGRFVDSNSQYTIPAITGAAEWIASQGGPARTGLAIYNIQDDFYNVNKIYKNTREAIGIMNPAPKN